MVEQNKGYWKQGNYKKIIIRALLKEKWEENNRKIKIKINFCFFYFGILIGTL